MSERTRTFAAIEIDTEQKQRIGRFCDELRARPGAGDWRWVRPEIIHITVRFFGDLDRNELEVKLSGLLQQGHLILVETQLAGDDRGEFAYPNHMVSRLLITIFSGSCQAVNRLLPRCLQLGRATLYLVLEVR